MTDKDLKIDTVGIQRDNHHSYYNHKYEPTDYDNLDILFTECPLHPEDTFVDFGCGKARINFYVNHRFQCNSIGIELSQEYYEDALRNLSTYNGIHKDKISFSCMPAQSYLLKGTENYFYFFNPFSVEIFGHVIQNIYESISTHPRECTLILYYPDAEYLYYLENYTGLTFVQEISLLANQEKDCREVFRVYQF